MNIAGLNASVGTNVFDFGFIFLVKTRAVCGSPSVQGQINSTLPKQNEGSCTPGKVA